MTLFKAIIVSDLRLKKLSASHFYYKQNVSLYEVCKSVSQAKNMFHRYKVSSHCAIKQDQLKVNANNTRLLRYNYSIINERYMRLISHTVNTLSGLYWTWLTVRFRYLDTFLYRFRWQICAFGLHFFVVLPSLSSFCEFQT